jgi:hypothetical protein
LLAEAVSFDWAFLRLDGANNLTKSIPDFIESGFNCSSFGVGEVASI